MKYNLKGIMNRAWEIKKEHILNLFAPSLKMAWNEAKKGMEIMEDAKLTWKDVAFACEEAVEDLGTTDYYIKNWKKGKHDRSYIEFRCYRKGKLRNTIQAGYWDNNTEEYITDNRYTKQYNVLSKDYE